MFMDVLARLQKLLNERGWSEYKLAKMAGLNESTISNIYRRNTVPTIATLEAICHAFGITLSEFFATDDTEIDLCTLISNTLDNAIEADPPDKKILLEMLDDGEKLLFSVTNRYEKKIEKNEDGSFISSKSDKQNHGLGIKNIEEAVARMNGKITVTAENGIFRVYAEVPTRK